MITNGLLAYRDKRILLLQGPVGPFFSRFSRDLEVNGAEVFKVNLNGGDWLFYPSNAYNFRGTMASWPDYIRALLVELEIDVVILFGDCRRYHEIAHGIARELDIEVGVFEEGYIRPDYITLEREGVNGFSALPDKPIFYLNNVEPLNIRRERVGNAFWYAAWWAFTYYAAAIFLRPFFKHYQHHRPLNIKEGFLWLRSLGRKWIYRFKERGLQQKLTGQYARRFYLVPLQVHNDAQIHVHSDFASVEDFICRVAASFATHAPADTLLAIKHHPLDRGYNDYSKLIARLARQHALEGRLLYIHDQHLPSLLNTTRGVVIVNSTVGMSALRHLAPVKTCGSAIYNLKGLTFQGTLNEFWAGARNFKINMDLLQRFQTYLIVNTQLNGSFYKKLTTTRSHSGVRWKNRHLTKVPRPSYDRSSIHTILAIEPTAAANSSQMKAKEAETEKAI